MALISKGTIHIKDADGSLIPFLPNTDLSNVRNGTVNLRSTVSNLKTRISEAARKGGVKVMYEMPTVDNTSTFGAKTFIGAIVPVSSDKTITLQATLLTKPSNGSFFVIGEEYKIQYDLFNFSDVQLDNVSLLLNDEEAISFQLDIAESKTLIYTSQITPDDVIYCIENETVLELDAELAFNERDNFQVIEDGLVQLNCIPTNSSYYYPSISISFQILSSPRNGSTYNLGETIQYKITVSNTGNATFDGPVAIEAQDRYGNETASWTTTELDLGKSVSFTNDVVVTENDIINRSGWKVSCLVEGTSFLGEEASFSNYRNITLAAINPTLKIELTAISSPASGNVWTNGEDVRYKLIASNPGNLTLSEVVIQDVNSDQSWTIASMAPGATHEFSDNSMHYVIPLDNEEGIISLPTAGSATAPSGYTTTIDANSLAIVTDHNVSFTYIVDTSRYNASNKTTGVPFIPSSGETIMVIWGDGSNDSFGSESTSSNRIHTYSTPGTYEVMVSSTNWNKTTLNVTTGSVTSSSNPALYWFRNTLKELNMPLFSIANTTLYYGFYGCLYLNSICEGFFQNCTQKTSYSYCFSGCTALASIPASLFEGCNQASLFSFCFNNCTSLTSLPSNLFKGCTSATSFASCFNNCTKLLSVDSSIFSECSAVTSFDSVFFGCSKLSSIPEGLFADCVGVTTFHYAFKSCTMLTNIPEDLFMHNTLATNFGGVFWYCKNIQSIPEDLLRYNVAAANVGAFFCYADGPAFSSFPENFLKYNINVTSLTSDDYGFFEGSSIKSFSLRIGSPKVSTAQYFCYNTSTTGVTRTVYVPAGSTTKTTMQGVASSFKLTIVEE